MNKVRVAVNGYGVIGKRVADAVALQEDMALAGIADVVHDYRLQVAARRGFAIHAATPDAEEAMRSAGIPVAGNLAELLAKADVVVDCTPKKVAAVNKALYDAASVKSVFHGGESHALTGHSFVAQANYASAIGRTSTRVVSCNTTSIVRTLGALRMAGLLKRARGTLIRRASDPWEAHSEGIINTLVPEKTIPSHQGPDARTVIPDLDVVTIAVKAAHNSSHLHTWWVELTRPATRDEVLAAFRAAPRIAFVRSSDGLVALNSTVELMADLGRPRGDMWEVALWEDGLAVDGDQAYYTYQVFNQAIVIPETIDAIRALSGVESDPSASIVRTDAALGLRHDFIRDCD
ncbi:glyceraldehyde-3-phosphate dehydrogenase (NAD(P)+) (phosphorylating) [Cupriavidus metallidurans]|uniref:type II glyceraldehyde-3-phosphate dehydrogenase n=1 Tax=Cupriavidus TaxID=106589 RepID=UPI0004936ADE|nr:MULTISPECIES: type II glyceraldehyde-3-phosphate dehydrogenase [Cupriavidus]KWR85441.1 glyceraldehyde-3-phosphate dehydrogenase [Cupriavidus sp. SHE]MDE4920209.1 type II glyceraldehyde-3-phosphate dehydrogenase [Cupriavidus metallidurans]GMG94600.1 glyceraldehyde-3-phosphate dehydrogenase [Cupriavidus sp. TKC]